MNRLVETLILFLILFLIIFVVDYFFIKRRYLKRLRGKKKSKNNTNYIIEITYLITKFKNFINALPTSKVSQNTSLSNKLFSTILYVFK